MHPLLARPSRLLTVILLAALFGVPLAWVLTVLTPRPWLAALAFAVPMQVVFAFIALSAWWVCRRYPMHEGITSRAVSAQLMAALQASAVWAALGAPLAVLLVRTIPDYDLSRYDILRDLGVVLLAGMPLYLLSATAHYLYLTIEATHAAQRRILETEVGAREAEVRALRAQLNPHFLFNSLNSINALIGSEPEGARRMCERLGDFLRRTLALSARDEVTLGEELELVERYLGIEQVRFGERLRVERAVDPDAAACRVPPLLLQPLVENAIKHGIQDLIEGGAVRIEARLDDGALRVVVENPVDVDAPARRGEGVGLDNVRRRLAAFGARDANLRSERKGDRFRVTLIMPARTGTEVLHG
ncbi:MAG: histidine kinase [Candidatus Eisenbacteria bacterium]|nr:histidine kinase [Candidatus Eisenbacteria bacterium]